MRTAFYLVFDKNVTAKPEFFDEFLFGIYGRFKQHSRTLVSDLVKIAARRFYEIVFFGVFNRFIVIVLLTNVVVIASAAFKNSG